MRTLGRALTAVLIGSLLLAGCAGEGTVDSEPDGSPSPSSRPDAPSMSIGDPVQEPTVVAVISEPGAGGRVTESPVPVGDAAALREFVDQFEGEMSREVSRAAAGASVPDGQTLLASVVDISCNPPQDVEVRVEDGGVQVVPVKTKDPGVPCYLEVTTVAIVTAIV